MSEDVYYKLGERLNEYPVKYPLMDEFLDILQEYYTPDQAALGETIPKGTHLARDLAKQLSRDEQELIASLESMADNGLIFTAKTDAGETEYSLTPFVPGVVEFQPMKGTDTEHDRKTARMMHDFSKTLEGLWFEALKDPEMAKQFVPQAPARTITVQKELPPGTEIYPFEKLAWWTRRSPLPPMRAIAGTTPTWSTSPASSGTYRNVPASVSESRPIS